MIDYDRAVTLRELDSAVSVSCQFLVRVQLIFFKIDETRRTPRCN